MVASLLTGLVLVLLAAAYHAGRRFGFRAGHKAGLAEAPLLLRMRYQLECHCPICDDSEGFSGEEAQGERCGN
ncbi:MULTISPECIES: hypothetical protein [Alicyclobacillus]|uniref:Uncharacterized protein n=1 Tax=Alicyclobacillus vulcanalis TaxID=252246 RepID=A0A1N7NI76_9BACL|nr:MULTISPECIES: hypothetical protein [Alicyclobacillus]SIS98000.1 hypothetical protein SAMN05421799_108147 [Alicyclobacillus vulcanalis]